MSIESNFSISLTSEPLEKHDEKQFSENNNIDIMCDKIGNTKIIVMYLDTTQPTTSIRSLIG